MCSTQHAPKDNKMGIFFFAHSSSRFLDLAHRRNCAISLPIPSPLLYLYKESINVLGSKRIRRNKIYDHFITCISMRITLAKNECV